MSDDGGIQEIYLDLPKMITIHSTLQNVKKLQFDDNNLYKVIIKMDNSNQTQTFLKSNDYKLLRKYATILFEYPKNEQIIPIKHNEPPNFKSILFDKIKGNKNMEYIFSKCLN